MPSSSPQVTLTCRASKTRRPQRPQSQRDRFGPESGCRLDVLWHVFEPTSPVQSAYQDWCLALHPNTRKLRLGGQNQMGALTWYSDTQAGVYASGWRTFELVHVPWRASSMTQRMVCQSGPPRFHRLLLCISADDPYAVPFVGTVNCDRIHAVIQRRPILTQMETVCRFHGLRRARLSSQVVY